VPLFRIVSGAISSELALPLPFTKNIVIFMWPAAAHALIGFKLNPRVISVQQQMSATFSPDQLTFGTMRAQKAVIDSW